MRVVEVRAAVLVLDLNAPLLLHLPLGLEHELVLSLGGSVDRNLVAC